MSSDTWQPVPYKETPDYFGFGFAAGFAEDFRTGAAKAYAKDEKWAKYWWSSYLTALVTYLQEGIFAVVAYPPAGFVIDDTDYIEKAERFRGWILQYVEQPYGWRVLAASQEIGMDEFKRVRRELKQG